MAVDIFTDAELQQHFGTPKLKPIGGGQFKIINGWDTENLITVFLPQLVGVPVLGQKSTGKMTFHKKAAPQLKAGFETVERAGLASKILSYEGSFNPRLIAGTNKVSRHTYAIAFDINGDSNPLHKKPAAKGKKGSLHEIAAVLENFGFGWGGNFENPDGMHFEVIKLLTKQQIAEQLEKFGGQGGVKLIVNGQEKDVVVTVEDGVSFAKLGSLLTAIGEPAPAAGQNTVVPVRQFLKGNGFTVTYDAAHKPDGAILVTK